jgi:hypothetical protein
MKTNAAASNVPVLKTRVQARAELRAAILEGLKSGRGAIADDAFWAKIRQKLKSG